MKETILWTTYNINCDKTWIWAGKCIMKIQIIRMLRTTDYENLSLQNNHLCDFSSNILHLSLVYWTQCSLDEVAFCPQPPILSKYINLLHGIGYHSIRVFVIFWRVTEACMYYLYKGIDRNIATECIRYGFIANGILNINHNSDAAIKTSKRSEHVD